MRYGYKILNLNTEVLHDSKFGIAQNGFETEAEAIADAEIIRNIKYKYLFAIIESYLIAENIVDEDALDGHIYPGHEIWAD